MASMIDRAVALFPAGSNGEFNLTPDLNTVIARGRGCELWDYRGRRFLDFSMGWGSVLVGHAHPAVVEAVTRRAPLGSNFAYITEESLALAEEIVRLSPASEQLRFCASGTEATLYGLRLARAFTRRSAILKFEGAYHGAHEAGAASLFPSSPAEFPEPDLRGTGLSPTTRAGFLVAPFNDLARTREIIRAHADELAAVIVEPLQRCIPPLPGFLAGLREAARESGLLLIFDEVVTGFRLAYGGAQEYYGVQPDLVAYGKALGGGYSIGAIGGRTDVMALFREDHLGSNEDYVWSASTLGGNPVSAAASLAALSVLRAEGVYRKLHELGRYLREGLKRALARQGIIAQVIGDGPLAQVVFTDREVRDYRSTLTADRDRARRLMLGLFARGVFLNPMGTKLYVSLAHDQGSCDEFLALFEEELRSTKESAETPTVRTQDGLST